MYLTHRTLVVIFGLKNSTLSEKSKIWFLAVITCFKIMTRISGAIFSKLKKKSPPLAFLQTELLLPEILKTASEEAMAAWLGAPGLEGAPGGITDTTEFDSSVGMVVTGPV